MDNVGDFFNELCYIYKGKYNEEFNSLNTKDKKINYTKLRLTDYYQYEYQNEEEQWTSKKFNKKEPSKNPTKTDLNELNELIIKKETRNYLKDI